MANFLRTAGAVSKGLTAGRDKQNALGLDRRRLGLMESQFQSGERQKLIQSANAGASSLLKDLKASIDSGLVLDPKATRAYMQAGSGVSGTLTTLSKQGFTGAMSPTLFGQTFADLLKQGQKPIEQRTQEEATSKATVAGAVTTATEQAKLNVGGAGLKRFGAFSPSTGKRFTGFDDGKGGIFMLENGELVPAPEDAFPVSSQVQGGTGDVLTQGETVNLRGQQREAEFKLDDISSTLKEFRANPGAGGFRGLLAEKVGGALGQLPLIGKGTEESFVKAVTGATPEEAQRIRFKARTLVAKLLTDITGEESGRFSEPERQITEKTLKGLDANASTAQIMAAMKVAMEAIVDSELRASEALGTPSFELGNPSGRGEFGDYLVEIGFSEDEAADIVVERVTRQRRRKKRNR